MADSPEWFTDSARRLIEQAVARAVAMDPAAQQRLADELNGRALRVHISDSDACIDVHFQSDGIRMAPGDDATLTDATVEASLAGLMSLAASRGQRSRDVTFRGDIGVIQAIRQLVSEIEIDWEEQLSHVTGDTIAHRVGEGVRSGRRWARHAGERLLQDLGEYVTEERELLPTEPEVSAFNDGVRRLRADVDRLEARLNRLRQKHGG
jgi:ubiquinone biosynthesis protein UbiJ